MYFRRKCKITFICHGATIYSEEGRFSDAENYPPLSELGVNEMELMTKYLKARGVKNEVIYTSPSVRTLQSAMMVAKVFKKDYQIIEELKPRTCGSLGGMTVSQLLDKYPDGFNKILEDPTNSEVPDVESSENFVKRIGKTIDKIVNENIGNRIIIVTHPDVIQAAICSTLSIPVEKLPTIFIRTGSATQISYFENWAGLVFSDYIPLG